MKEYIINGNIARVHGEVNYDKVKKATKDFLKKVELCKLSTELANEKLNDCG